MVSRPGGASPDPQGGIPLLHVVTDDRILARPDFLDRARELLALGPRLALHLRGPGASGARLYALAVALAGGARGRLVVNDRVDVAECAGAWGVQLPAASFPVEVARRITRPGTHIGASVHDRVEARAAGGADWLTVGTLWPSPSHPGRRGGGVERLAEVEAPSGVPRVGIGGVTPERVAAAVAAGASAVATIRGVWDASDPVAAAHGYLAALGEAIRETLGDDA